MFDTYGSDAMRWFLMSSPVLRGGDLVVTERGIRDAVRQVLLPLWNVWYFFSLYANADGGTGYDAQWSTTRPTCSTATCWPRLRDLVDDVSAQMDAYDLSGACAVACATFLDALTNWYVRRSRDRFWGDGRRATRFDTLYTVLETLCRVAAPLLPLTTEEIWRGLTGGRSVHLTDWPDADALPADARPGRRDGRASARSARRRCRCARPRGCGSGCRCRR